MQRCGCSHAVDVILDGLSTDYPSRRSAFTLAVRRVTLCEGNDRISAAAGNSEAI